jgi:hypothetical protein
LHFVGERAADMERGLTRMNSDEIFAGHRRLLQNSLRLNQLSVNEL